MFHHLGRCFLLVINSYLKCHLFIEGNNIFSVKMVTCILLRFLSSLCRLYFPSEMLNALLKNETLVSVQSSDDQGPCSPPMTCVSWVLVLHFGK